MLKIIMERLHQGYRTLDYPYAAPRVSPRFAGLPVIAAGHCASCGDRACLGVCPTKALHMTPDGVELDMGRCLFCRACERVCRSDVITFTTEHRLAAYTRDALVVKPTHFDEDEEDILRRSHHPGPDHHIQPLSFFGHRIGRKGENDESEVHPSGPRTGIIPARGEQKRDLSLFARSLKLREVSAGGCMACEADVNVLGTLIYDLGRFGIEYAASPRHADGILVTGPCPENMKAALLDTWEAVPEPRVVVCVGTCTISGGTFCEGREKTLGLESVLPEGSIDVYVPGCPPNPWTILDGILSVAWKKANAKKY